MTKMTKSTKAKKHFLKASKVSLGSMGLVIATMLSGCFDDTVYEQNMQQKQTANFVVLQETAKGQYKIVEEYKTSGQAGAIIRKLDGTQQRLSQQELEALVQEEKQRLEQGDSRLTQDQPMGGMSMGEAILSSMAGVFLGQMLFNSLMGNKNFQRKMQNPSFKSPNANKANSRTTNNRKSGFMGGSSSKKRGGFSFGG